MCHLGDWNLTTSFHFLWLSIIDQNYALGISAKVLSNNPTTKVIVRWNNDSNLAIHHCNHSFESMLGFVALFKCPIIWS